MSNLRQIGIATQTYLNDNDGVLFSPATPWMSQLNPKYVTSWGIFQSPFDKRSPSEAGTGVPVSPISYGVNVRIYPLINGTLTAMSASKITTPTGFILFAPAQDNTATVNFQGSATTIAPGVTLLGNNSSVTSNPPEQRPRAVHTTAVNESMPSSPTALPKHALDGIHQYYNKTTAGTPNQWNRSGPRNP